MNAEQPLSSVDVLRGDSDSRAVEIIDLGRIEYEECRERQVALVADLIAGRRERGVLILCEHDDVVTVGRAGRKQVEKHLVGGRAALAMAGVPLVETDRGGDVTWHGPGQLVGYPILPLARYRKDAEWYVRSLEEVILRALCDGFGIKGERVDGRSGVWVAQPDGPPAKVAALGVAFRRWVTYHGFALNVCPDLTRFDLIVPCGIEDAHVTSISREQSRRVSLGEAKAAVIEAFAELITHGRGCETVRTRARGRKSVG